MSFLDKMKNGGTGAESTQQDARDSVYEAVHLDTQGSESAAAPTTTMPDSQLSAGPDSTLTSTVYSTMEPLPVKVGDTSLSWQRLFAGFAIAGLAGTVLSIGLNTWLAARSSEQVRAAGQAMMQSQRLAKATSTAMVGTPVAFAELRESLGVLTGVTRNLATGDGKLARAPGAVRDALAPVAPMVDKAEKSVKVVLEQEKLLTQVGQSLRAINRQSSDLLDAAETVASHALQTGGSATEIAATGQLVMLTQRIGKSASEFLTNEGVSTDAVFLLGNDLNAFKAIAEGLLNGRPRTEPAPRTRRDGP